MNILAIDTVDFTAGIGLFSKGRFKVVTYPSRSRQLLAEIDKLLKSKKLKIADIDGFVAYLGPGESFTGTRVGISAINALCFALDKPSFGYFHIPETDVKARVYQMLQRSTNLKKFVKHILKPVYSKPAIIS